MFDIYNKGEWSKILEKYPKPSDEIKEEIWNRTRQFPMPMKDISWQEAEEDFKELCKIDSTPLIKTDDIFSRYDYKWDLGNTYIDMCNVGNKSSNFYHQENRFKCDSINAPSPYRTWNDKKFFFTLLQAVWTLKLEEINSDELRQCIALRKYIASQFRPSAAKCIYDFFKSENVLDFSSGWGDRLNGAFSSNSIKSYMGIDPNRALCAGYYSQVQKYNTNKQIDMICGAAEDVLPTLEDKEIFDLVFTSPPYFIIERYNKEDTQSWQRYKKIEIWLSQFLFKVISESWKRLKSGGHLAINISDVYCNHTINKICDPMNDFIQTLPQAAKVSNLNYRMAKRINSKSNKKGIFVEPLWVWKKGN